MTDHTKLETTAMDRIEIAKAIYHATPRNKPFDKLSAFKRERILAEADAFLASLSAAGYRILGPDEVDPVTDQWQPIETAPKDAEFLATNGTLLGVGRFYRHVEPDTKHDWDAWRRYRESVLAPFGEVPFNQNGCFAEGFDYLGWNRKRDEAWEAAKDKAPLPVIPNPKAGEVDEWFYASAVHAFDGEADTFDYDGPVGFRPTHWMPLPTPPAAIRAIGRKA